MSGTMIAILVTILIIVCIVLGVYITYKLKKKKDNTQAQDNSPELVELQAVQRLKGSNPFGYETNEEVKNRLNAIQDKKEFKALNINDRPFSHDEWNKLSSDEAIENRNQVEMSLCFLYTPDGNKNPDTEGFLIRQF